MLFPTSITSLHLVLKAVELDWGLGVLYFYLLFPTALADCKSTDKALSVRGSQHFSVYIWTTEEMNLFIKYSVEVEFAYFCLYVTVNQHYGCRFCLAG